jgi:hypothetical protein
VWEPSTGTSHRLPKTGIQKTLLATMHVAFVGCHGNLVYRVVSWIPVLVTLWEVPVEGSHRSNKLKEGGKNTIKKI